MSSLIVDNLATPWGANRTGLWTLSINVAPSAIGENSRIMAITAQRGSEGDPTPFARRIFVTPLDMSGREELLFQFRSSRVGDGSPGKPFYLAFEASSNPPDTALSWSRLLPVKIADTWETYRLWLGDMPASLRRAVGFLQLRSLDPTVAFNASIGIISAVIAEPLQDVEQAMLDRLNHRFQVSADGGIIDVPALIDLPENPGERDPPYILITPLSIKPGKEGAGEIIDNYTTGGAFVRPSPKMVQIEYVITVFAQERPQKAFLFESILNEFNRIPYIYMNGERLGMTLFLPSTEEEARFDPPGQTPLFYRLTIFMEIGSRQFRPIAVPFIKTGPISGKETSEVVKV